MSSIYVCETHSGIFVDSYATCNIYDGETCNSVLYVKVEPLDLVPIVTELETFDALWNLDEQRFNREDVAEAHKLVVSYLGGNFYLEEALRGKPPTGYRAGKRNRGRNGQRPTRRRN